MFFFFLCAHKHNPLPASPGSPLTKVSEHFTDTLTGTYDSPKPSHVETDKSVQSWQRGQQASAGSVRRTCCMFWQETGNRKTCGWAGDSLNSCANDTAKEGEHVWGGGKQPGSRLCIESLCRQNCQTVGLGGLQMIPIFSKESQSATKQNGQTRRKQVCGGTAFVCRCQNPLSRLPVLIGEEPSDIDTRTATSSTYNQNQAPGTITLNTASSRVQKLAHPGPTPEKQTNK